MVGRIRLPGGWRLEARAYRAEPQIVAEGIVCAQANIGRGAKGIKIFETQSARNQQFFRWRPF